MIRSTASKVMWMGRATVFLVGLAVILALMFGAASMAFAANGNPWILGKANVATAITSLGGKLGVNGPMVRITNNNAGANDTALDLRVQAGEAPMRVNSQARVANLNADKIDGKDSTQIGVNGLQRVAAYSASNSESPKAAEAQCPSGKVVVGTGHQIGEARSSSYPNALTDVVVAAVIPYDTSVLVAALEEEATSADWVVEAYAICAQAP